MPENLACPSCGNEDLVEWADPHRDHPEIFCLKCGMRGPVGAWDFRVPASQLVYAYAEIVRLREAIRGLLMVSLPGDVSGQRHVDNAREALEATESLPISYPINASTKSET